jgi:hypothetical protein
VRLQPAMRRGYATKPGDNLLQSAGAVQLRDIGGNAVSAKDVLKGKKVRGLMRHNFLRIFSPPYRTGSAQVVLVGTPAAFSPVCSMVRSHRSGPEAPDGTSSLVAALISGDHGGAKQKHLPTYMDNAAAFRSKGIDQVRGVALPE